MILSPQMLQFASLFDCVDDVLAWIKEPEGRYVWVNRAFAVGYSLDRAPDAASALEILGRTDYDLSPAFLADQFRMDDEYVLTGRRIVDRIELVGQPGGAAEWNVTNKLPLVDEKGAVVGTAGITRKMPDGASAAAGGAALRPVLAYFRDHYQAGASNRRLASLVHLSVRAFERRFRQEFHVAPQLYLRKLRLRMASRALVHSGQSLGEVAVSCGFADQSHFTRAFRQHFGVTPRAYRERYSRQAYGAASVPEVAAPMQDRRPSASL